MPRNLDLILSAYRSYFKNKTRKNHTEYITMDLNSPLKYDSFPEANIYSGYRIGCDSNSFLSK